MTHLTLPSGQYLIIEVPEDAEPYLLGACNRAGMEPLFALTYLLNEKGGPLVLLPVGSWQIVGRASSLTEQEWSGIVKVVDVSDAGLNLYEDYNNIYDQLPFHTATESGHSLLTANKCRMSDLIVKRT